MDTSILVSEITTNDLFSIVFSGSFLAIGLTALIAFVLYIIAKDEKKREQKLEEHIIELIDEKIKDKE